MFSRLAEKNTQQKSKIFDAEEKEKRKSSEGMKNTSGNIDKSKYNVPAVVDSWYPCVMFGAAA